MRFNRLPAPRSPFVDCSRTPTFPIDRCNGPFGIPWRILAVRASAGRSESRTAVAVMGDGLADQPVTDGTEALGTACPIRHGERHALSDIVAGRPASRQRPEDPQPPHGVAFDVTSFGRSDSPHRCDHRCVVPVLLQQLVCVSVDIQI